jgi:pyruvate dehydrogenase E2 component (dihydrolipoamide acetyltransferase)
VPIQSIRIPQMGEGLQEALLVEFLKQPGDFVRRDEAIYVMETDKATTEVESPYSGQLVEWTVKAGTVIPIGTEVARMEVDAANVMESNTPHEGFNLSSPSHSPEIKQRSPDPLVESPSATNSSEVFIPPRTRKYLKDKGILDQAHRIPASGNKLMPEDVDRYLDSLTAIASPSPVIAEFDERPVSKQQITLNYRLVRSVQTTVPVTVMTEVDWTAMATARQRVKELGGKETSFAMMLWCVVQTMRNHPRFRTSLLGDGTTYRTYRHVHLGVAVALPEDTLVTAALHRAEELERNEFMSTLATKIEQARQGVDQADPSLTLSVSNIGSACMRFGIPAIVAPAAATLALGEVFEAPVPKEGGFQFQKRAQLTLAFDHRIINGVGAADFMNDLKKRIESFS